MLPATKTKRIICLDSYGIPFFFFFYLFPVNLEIMRLQKSKEGACPIAGKLISGQGIDYQRQELPLTSESNLRLCDLLIPFPRLIL